MKKLLGILVLSALTCGAFAQDSPMRDTAMTNMSHMKKDCVMMKDGKMMVMKHGETMMMMDKSVKLNNGAMVMKDGTVTMSDGATKMLKEGQYIDMDGKMGMMKKKMKNDKMQ